MFSPKVTQIQPSLSWLVSGYCISHDKLVSVQSLLCNTSTKFCEGWTEKSKWHIRFLPDCFVGNWKMRRALVFSMKWSQDFLEDDQLQILHTTENKIIIPPRISWQNRPRILLSFVIMSSISLVCVRTADAFETHFDSRQQLSFHVTNLTQQRLTITNNQINYSRNIFRQKFSSWMQLKPKISTQTTLRSSWSTFEFEFKFCFQSQFTCLYISVSSL